MTDPIVRMYETEQQARDAVRTLQDKGFPADRVFLVTPEAGGEGGSLEAIASAIMAGYVLRSHARVYAKGIQAGRSLVVIRAPFSSGKLATYIMDSFGPVDTGLRLPKSPPLAWDEAAPLSSALQLPKLLQDQPAPFSAVLGLRLLSTGRTFLARYAELTGSDWTFSSRLGLGLLSRRSAARASLWTKGGLSWTRSFGLPMLSSNPAPLSTKLGLHLLTGPLPRSHPSPFSERLGLPTLSHGRTFLSGMFGALASPHFALFGRGALVRNPAPFSSLIGQRLLLDNPAPLSAMLGRPVLRD